MAASARNILKSCAQPQKVPLHWPDLMGLQHTYWLAVSELLSFIRRAGPLSTTDFEDQGERFRRLVLNPAEGTTRQGVDSDHCSGGFVG